MRFWLSAACTYCYRYSRKTPITTLYLVGTNQRIYQERIILGGEASGFADLIGLDYIPFDSFQKDERMKDSINDSINDDSINDSINLNRLENGLCLPWESGANSKH
mmetsp:Transcript_11215/g.23683  ORF Transcript_11215/g.23683 Transcript_11215/m.23683 type:complete len:106 (+) Transcript_11215:55-372(+)